MKGNGRGNTEVPEFIFVSVNAAKLSLFTECPENREKTTHVLADVEGTLEENWVNLPDSFSNSTYNCPTEVGKGYLGK